MAALAEPSRRFLGKITIWLRPFRAIAEPRCGAGVMLKLGVAFGAVELAQPPCARMVKGGY
jgi:hypothetical protein